MQPIHCCLLCRQQRLRIYSSYLRGPISPCVQRPVILHPDCKPTHNYMDKALFAPRYWPSWLGLAILRLIAFLPFRTQLSCGRLVGLLLYHLARHRRHIVYVNLQLCFPELDTAAIRALARETMINNTIGLFEAAYVWWGNIDKLVAVTEVQGLDTFQAALAKGRGVVLLGGHYSTLELGGALLSRFAPLDVTYRRHNNALLDAIITRHRQRYFGAVIERRQIRQCFRRLKQGHAVWYAADQDYGRRNAVFAPFFGIPAATVTGFRNLARFNDSEVIWIAHYRKADDSGYLLRLSGPFDNFPSDDNQRDAERFNQILQSTLRDYPSQYMWTHRRFKTRPDHSKNFYQQGYKSYLNKSSSGV